MLTGELLTYLFDGRSHFLAHPMEMWLTPSRRFTAFVDTFRDKIRKKIRVTQDQETLLDLHLELDTAYRLLQERTLIGLTQDTSEVGALSCWCKYSSNVIPNQSSFPALISFNTSQLLCLEVKFFNFPAEAAHLMDNLHVILSYFVGYSLNLLPYNPSSGGL